MRRSWLYIIGAALVVAAVVGILLARNSGTNHADKTASKNAASTNHSTAFPQRKACSIFTLADAKQVLGDNAKGGETANSSSSNDLEVSACNYTQDTGSNAPVSASDSASLLARAPKTGAGTTSNQNQFGPLKPANSEPVAGYGDNAYWDPQYGQLNILKNNTWYIVSFGPITPASRSLDQTKQLADILIDKM
ncbi:hypothetical protein KW801_01640 [Candidatus Saccharibacteria bacterium]|nr:hypothetical protein [Candidatus Saccharibacteria bacterium]